MTDGFGLGAGAIPTTITQWENLGDLMSTAQGDLAGESTSSFAPSVQGTAAAFLAAWSGFAGESSELAAGFVSALRSTQTLYGQSDRTSAGGLDRLDGRLGPAR